MLHKNVSPVEEERAHITLKAVTTVGADEGTFEAVISTEGVDREKDVVSAPGMVAALKRWNRPVPLAWNHSTKAEDIFGSVDPQTAQVVGTEVAIGGQVDLDSKVGAEAWRSFKSRTVGFSFGYLILASTKRAGGGRHITDLDVFEVTATPTPMNNDTRVLSTKELRDAADQLAREVEETQIPEVPEQPEAPVEPEPDLVNELQEVKGLLADVRAELDALKKANETGKAPRARSVDSLRQQAEAIALEVASGGISLPKPPKSAAPTPEPSLSLKDLKARMRDEMLGVLSGEPTT